ncbi:site-specific integrase [Polaribacter sp. R2A056_3_33]|uniref:site-specific integrase n=1 Tax=Polaribacter sp. R2A056_3_33 TaxID=2745563 RepID=UPI001C4F7295|nr:site-specific integrase [Polaribacter sp. R2A056_3_33]QXP69210.1 site-specific integrase [Polaribacter sp. R2A056_3_33]
MKKHIKNTKVAVKLRKSEYHNEWYLYIESYPVIIPNKEKPQRIREYLNRTITTPIWDKKRTARTKVDGTKTYKVKRDINGVIQCKSDIDKENCLYADGVRKLRQKEYDNANLYNDTEKEYLAQKEKLKENFIQYFKDTLRKRHKNSSNSIQVNWKRTIELLRLFYGEYLPFSKLNLSLAEDFKNFIKNAPCGGGKKGIISNSTSSTYYSIFKACLKQAFIDGYLTIDLSGKIKGIRVIQSKRAYLTIDELNKLASTPCEMQVLRRASLFSALTGLRLSDIQKLRWKEVVIENGKGKLLFTQKKTKGVEYTPISNQALELCGTPSLPEKYVFEDLPNSSWISRPLKKWITASGIQKNITFHCFRHTYATLQLANGTDIYTVSKMLGHTNVSTTQIYSKVIDNKKDIASQVIQINIDN